MTNKLQPVILKQFNRSNTSTVKSSKYILLIIMWGTLSTYYYCNIYHHDLHCFTATTLYV